MGGAPERAVRAAQDRARPPALGRPDPTPAVAPRGPSGGPALLHLQRTAGNRAVRALLAERHRGPAVGAAGEHAEPATAARAAEVVRSLQASRLVPRRSNATAPASPVVQRTVWVKHGTDQADLQQALSPHLKGIGQRQWYQTRVSPKLYGQFGYMRFAGYMANRTGQYDLDVTAPKPLKDLSFDELTTAVTSAINTRLLSQKIEKGHSTIGDVKLLSRQGFPSAVKNAFDKVPVIREIKSEGRGAFEPKQIHLRHFVMGSWFRALPNVVKKAKLGDADAADLAKRVATLVPRVGPFAGRPGVASTGDAAQDLDILALLLHDLLPNLNAGEGPENTLIGFMSNGLSNLAEDVRTDKIAFNRDELDDLILTAVDAITLVSTEHRTFYKDEFDPVSVFAAMVQQRVGDSDPVEPAAMSMILHDFSFQLGMDLMKRQAGMSKGTPDIATCQEALLPVGQYLYSLIVKAQTTAPDVTELDKLFNAVESAVATFERFAAKATSS